MVGPLKWVEVERQLQGLFLWQGETTPGSQGHILSGNTMGKSKQCIKEGCGLMEGGGLEGVYPSESENI